MLKCMLENDVFVNAKPNKINKENKEIKVQKNIKKSSAWFLGLSSIPEAQAKNGFLMKKTRTVWKWNK